MTNNKKPLLRLNAKAKAWFTVFVYVVTRSILVNQQIIVEQKTIDLMDLAFFTLLLLTLNDVFNQTGTPQELLKQLIQRTAKTAFVRTHWDGLPDFETVRSIWPEAVLVTNDPYQLVAELSHYLIYETSQLAQMGMKGKDDYVIIKDWSGSDPEAWPTESIPRNKGE